MLMLSACSTTPRKTVSDGMTSSNIYPVTEERLLLTTTTQLDNNNIDRARNLLNQIDVDRLSNNDLNHYHLLKANLAVITHNSQSALNWLSTIKTQTLNHTQQITYHQIKINAYEMEGKYSQTIEQLGMLLQYLPTEDYPERYNTLWKTLILLDESQLQHLLSTSQSEPLKPWIELAFIYQTLGELKHQLSELQNWQQRWPTSDALRYLPQSIVDLQNSKPYQPDSIALLLPMSGPLAQAGGAIREGLMAAYYETMKKKLHVPRIQFYDSANSDPVKLALQAEAEGAELIIGPLSRNAVEKAVSNRQITIPQLTLNYINDATLTVNLTYKMGIAAQDEAKQSAQRAWQDGFRNPVMLIPDDDWGQRVATAFAQEWQLLGGNLLSTVHYTEKGDFNKTASTLLLINESQQRANNLQRILKKKLNFTPRRRHDIDMIFMAATAANGRQLKPALDFYFAYDIPVYTTSSIYSGQQNPSKDHDLSGIRFPIMPWHLSKELPLKIAITYEWPSSTGQYGSLYALGADAWLIYPRMEQMSQSPSAKMLGTTGTLSINEYGNVERQLIWQYFHNGLPTPLTHKHSAKKTHEIHVLDSDDQKPTG